MSQIKLNKLIPQFMFGLLYTFALSCSAGSISQPTIAIIIDDMGHSYQNGRDLIEMPYPLTLAFLPLRPHTNELSMLADKHGKEIMLHAPMENTLGIELGKGALTTSMSEQQIKSSLIGSLRSLPFVVGVNNHTGSKLTTQPTAMTWVMEVLKDQPFYFVDSRTSADSVAAKVAQKYNIPNLSRDIFLDHEQSRKFVQKQFNKLIDLAREKGHAIAIGHPHRVTIDYLNWALPRLDEKGVRISTISSLWQILNPQQKMHTAQNSSSKLASLNKPRHIN